MGIATGILLGSFIILVIMRVPIGFSLIGSSLLTCLYLKIPMQVIWLKLTTGVQSFSLLAVPFFILAGEIMMSGGISAKLLDFADIFVGRFRGGMARVSRFGLSQNPPLFRHTVLKRLSPRRQFV